MRMAARQIPFDLGHTPSHAEADFLVGEGNALAHAHILAWPQWPGPLTLLVGPEHAGKSHLARIWAERAEAVFAEPANLTRLSQSATLDPVVIEDVDRRGYTEDALFHLLNQSMRDARPVLMTARDPIEAWPFRTADLKSRARLAARFDLAPSDDIELSHMLVKLFADRQVVVEPRIISYLVARMERSATEAARLVDAMDRLSLARGGAMTLPIATAALAERARDARNEPAGDATPGEQGDDDE